MRLLPAVLTLVLAGTVLLSGCAPARYQINMDEYAQYNENYSFARNLARLQGYERTLKDTKVPKDMISDWGAVGMGTDLLVDSWLYNINPSMPGSFGIGAGIKLINWLVAPPKVGEFDTMCAFVPVSVAATEADARDYLAMEMIKALKATIKDQGYEIADIFETPQYYDVDVKKSSREQAWNVTTAASLIDESVGCTRKEYLSCEVANVIKVDSLPQEPKPIPAWLDPKQPLAWFIPHIRLVAGFKGADYDKRDELRLKWLTGFAKHLPEHTYMYVSPARKDGKRTPPFYTNGKKMWFFVIPKD